MIVTEKAEKKVAELIKESQIATPDWVQFFRVQVQPGGCSGLRYQMYFDYEIKEGDVVYNLNGFDLRIDKLSHPYLEGAIFDYTESIEKIGFTIDNPNSQGACSCGGSFH